MSSNLHISIIQTALHWEEKKQNLEKISLLLQQVQQYTHIVVLPEMFSTGFTMNAALLAESMEGETMQWLKSQAIHHKKIITGSIIIEEGGQYYNRLIWMLPTGEYFSYDKAHLFGKAGEDRHYTAGAKRMIVQVNGWKILLQTCYDLRFPMWARQDHHLYDVMINVANWPELRSAAWKTLLKARAIENQAYVIACNVCGEDGNGFLYSGDSAGIDFNGELMWTAVNEEAIGYVCLDKEKLNQFREEFPFLQDRDRFLILD